MEDPSVTPPQPLADPSSVLRLLAAGCSPQRVAERLSEGFDEHWTISDVWSVLRETAVLLEAEAPLSPPAEAAFHDHFEGVVAFATLTRGDAGSPSPPELDRLRALARRVVQRYLDAGDDATHVATTVIPPGQQSVALQYAEAVLRQSEIMRRLASLGEGEPLQAALPEPDRRRVDAFLLYRGLRGRFQTVDSLVDGWQRLVDGLNDHPESILYEEYEDWLIQRDSLETALSLISPAPRGALELRVRELDQGFLATTRPAGSSIKTTSTWRAGPWWWFRVPSRMSESVEARVGR
jgi:hypothetical protein